MSVTNADVLKGYCTAGRGLGDKLINFDAWLEPAVVPAPTHARGAPPGGWTVTY